MKSIQILVVAFAVAASAPKASAQSLLDRLIPIFEDAVGSGKAPKAAPVAVKAPTKPVVKKVVNKVKGDKTPEDPTKPDVIIESSPPSSILSDVPSTLESDVPSSLESDAPSYIISDAPSDIFSDMPSISP